MNAPHLIRMALVSLGVFPVTYAVIHEDGRIARNRGQGIYRDGSSFVSQVESNQIKSSQVQSSQILQQQWQITLTSQRHTRNRRVHIRMTTRNQKSRLKVRDSLRLWHTKSLTKITTGPLKYIGDPLGKGLGTVLSPVGAGLGKVTGPVGNALGGITKPALGPLLGKKEEKAEVLGGDNKDSYVHGKTSLGGHLQTGENPLGLNETGSNEFAD
jgi:hypothetical protein